MVCGLCWPRQPYLVAWDDDFLGLDVLETGDQFIYCSVHIRSMHTHVLLAVVYGVNDVVGRRVLWGDMARLSHMVRTEPWLVGGDFNTVVDVSEVCGQSGDIRGAAEEFQDCIRDTGLISLPVQGEWFTWHNCSRDARSLWKRLDRILVNDRWLERWPNSSYMSLNARTSDHSPLILCGDSPGRSASMFRFDNYLARSAEFIPSVRRIWQHNIVGTAMYGVTRKLKALKPVFRAQRQKKGDLSNNVRLAASFLEEAQSLLAQDRHCELLLHLEFCCKLVMRLASRLEQHMLQQRAKMAWMKDGDQCSRIFFRKVAKRRSSKRVFQITGSDGQTCTSPSEVTDTFIEYYQNLLGGHRRTHLMDLRYLRPWARHILSEDDARLLVRPVSPNEVNRRFLTSMRLRHRGLMDTPLPSLRRLAGCWWGRDMCYYGVLQNWQVTQTGRSISDNILLAQELFSGYNQRHLPPRCALKVDLRKAYDTVEWDFLHAVLTLFGFPAQFIAWIMECVSTPSYSVCINGLPHGFFSGARGLRQGDPMSPFLFVLVMEKSHLILSRAALPLRDALLATLDFQEGHLPLRYLGLPLLASRLTIADCQPILRKIDDRIKGWEGIMLSFAGRVQLIKSVLSALQVYWAMAFILPKHIIKEIEKRLRRFLWKGSTDVGLDFPIPTSGRLYLDDFGPYWYMGMAETGTVAGFIATVHPVSSWGWPSCFSSAAAYAIYAPPFPKVVWSSLLVGTFKIPRQRFILWLAILHRLSTLDRPWLQHMGTTCVLCQDDLPETHEHLFFSCTFATACIQAIRSTIFFPWPVRDWSPAVQWAARRWRGKHVVNASFRALLASLVYHLWHERNRRIFQDSSRTADSIARIVVSEIRELIICKQLPRTVSSRGLYRLWRIPWPVEGEAST
ncbi:UNVERIFIED_CONTAM: Retrovirus-related Pol polyprotein from type-2 retrotransposable element R2DM [Sesamum radiatum]|uniref:Retrovirus-related Pol polyprotein from type-2 retrotransposable element R2DM n=1 Tax=Sesamum radiatum TaxID=300843 RepID=A0AAW2IQQ8_SESRA